ncbi:MAG TPA: glycosyltransferase family 4 protein, partial [Acidobacteriota bacterium]|nr:glycosyltransferase family 4 protein [Acidobacteriota bacterium]
QYYKDADVFLLLSRWEGVPLAILEAMAYGNIVVATDVGGVSEIVEDGTTGFLVDATQPDDLLTEEVCITSLDIIQNPRKYDELRMNAFSSAMDFSWAKSARILSEVIDSLIAADDGGL